MRCRLGFHSIVMIWDPTLLAEPFSTVQVYRYCRRCHKTDAPPTVLARWVSWMISQVGPGYYA